MGCYLGIPLFGCQRTSGIIYPRTLYSTLFSGLIALQWELFFRESPLTLYSTLFSDFTTCRRKLFFRESPLTLYSTLFSRLDEKNVKLFCGKTVGTLSSLIIESKNIFCEIFFRTNKKQKKKTGSADSRRCTRETIRGATEI